MTVGTTGRPALGWGNVERPIAPIRAGEAHPLLLDVSAFSSAGLAHAPSKPSPFEAITGSTRSFADTESLGAEILRLKEAAVAPGHEDSVRAAVRQQIIMRQAEWVTMAKREGRQEPSSPFDPFRATPSQVADAFLWSEAGGVIPRDALAQDGGRAFTQSVRDAVVLRTHGFDTMLALHAGKPDEQRALLAQELTRRGVPVPADASLDALGALYRQSVFDEESLRPTMGLDGHTGTADQMDAYERAQVIAAMNPGTTLGSMMATWAVLVSGGIDLDRMRAMGNAGDAAEGMFGGAGVHMNAVAVEREDQFVPKKDLDNFNRTGLKPRFELKEMSAHYQGEHLPGNDTWNKDAPNKPYEVRYAERPTERAPFKLEARSVTIDGTRETRLFDAEGKLFDTREAVTHDGAPRAIFVMNAQGELYSSTFQEARYMHHSSLSGGEPVAAAGELMVENGRVVGITNRSGHYRPDPEHTLQLISSLREMGLDLSGVRVATFTKDGDPFAPDVSVLK